MQRKNKSFSGATLEKALQEGTLNSARKSLTGMVKPSQKSGFISFSHSDCNAWVDLPTEMIEEAEYLGHSSCRDHTHPMMKISLTEPKSDEGRVLYALLAQAESGPATSMSMDQVFHAGLWKGQGDLRSAGQQGVPVGALSRMMGGFGGFRGFGGLGPTLPGGCHYETILLPCGSALPSYPVPMCPTLVYCCTFPDGSKGCV
jgi:hypothetical protein